MMIKNIIVYHVYTMYIMINEVLSDGQEGRVMSPKIQKKEVHQISNILSNRKDGSFKRNALDQTQKCMFTIPDSIRKIADRDDTSRRFFTKSKSGSVDYSGMTTSR